MSLSAKEVEEITNQYYKEIYKFCCARCCNADAAFDAAQETFLTFVKKKKELTPENIRAWLYRTAENKCREYYRQHSREEMLISFEEIGDRVGVTDEVPVFSEIQKTLTSVLTEEEKELFTLLYVERESVPVVAEKLGVSESNLYQKNSRLKKKLRKNFKKTDFFLLVLAFRLSGM